SIVCLSALLRVCETGQIRFYFGECFPSMKPPTVSMSFTRTEFFGTLLIDEEIWRADGTFLLSLSEHQDLQEAMRWMSASSLDTNRWGRFVVEPGPNPGIATLRLQNCGILGYVRFDGAGGPCRRLPLTLTPVWC